MYPERGQLQKILDISRAGQRSSLIFAVENARTFAAQFPKDLHYEIGGKQCLF